MAADVGRGVLGWGVYLPYRRLDRATIAPVAGLGGGQGWRTVAGYDEDTTSMGVEAARAARRSAPDVALDALWFSTVAPTYLDKTNATTVHAALRLSEDVAAYDAVGSVRSAMGALRAAVRGTSATLVVASDLRTGRPGSTDEAEGGDGAAALVVGGPDDGPVLAEVVGWGTATREFLDRWRVPGSSRSQSWEERFGEVNYVPLGVAAFEAALKDAGLAGDDVDHVLVTGTHKRATAATTKALRPRVADSQNPAGGVGLGKDAMPADRTAGGTVPSSAGLGDAVASAERVAQGQGVVRGARAETDVMSPARVASSLAASVGNTGAAHPALLLASALETAAPGQVVALVVLADGAEAVLLRTTDAIAYARPGGPSVAAQVAGGAPVGYGTYLAWRGWLPVEPPRRPPPARPSAAAAARSTDWKFGFVGSVDDTGEIHLPPSPLDREARPMADAVGTIATFTVDRLAYSPSPPVVFAVIDFDGGGRVPVELTDVDVDEVAIGARVRMTFRRLSTADGIANYFWKATLLRDETAHAAAPRKRAAGAARADEGTGPVGAAGAAAEGTAAGGTAPEGVPRP